jgi:hypothetical protein
MRSEKLNKNKAIKYFKQFSEIDGSLESIKQRYMLIAMAFLIDDYVTIEKYAPLLTNIIAFGTKKLLCRLMLQLNIKNMMLH